MSVPWRMTYKLQTKRHKFHDNFSCLRKASFHTDIGLPATYSSRTRTVLCTQPIALTGHATSSNGSNFCSEVNTFESRLKFSVFSSFPLGKFWYKR